MKDKTTEIFRDAPVPKAVINNAIPSIISMIMVLVYNLADTFFIGQTKNAYMVAAVSVATPAFLLFMAVGMLFGIGGTSLISRMLGEGNSKKAKNASSFCFWTGLTIGVIAMAIIWIFATPVSRAIGASDETLGYTSQYLNIVAAAIPFLIVGNSFSNIIRAEGNAKVAMAMECRRSRDCNRDRQCVSSFILHSSSAVQKHTALDSSKTLSCKKRNRCRNFGDWYSCFSKQHFNEHFQYYRQSDYAASRLYGGSWTWRGNESQYDCRYAFNRAWKRDSAAAWILLWREK